MMARVAAARSVTVVVVSSLFVLSLGRRTVDQLPGDSASSLQAPLLLPPGGESDPSVADQVQDNRTNLEAAKPLAAAAAAAAEEEDPTAVAVAVAVADRRPPEADRRVRRSFLPCLLGGCGIEALHSGGGGDAAALPAAAAAEAEQEEEEAERAVAVAGANRSSAEVMGWIPEEEDGAKEKDGERAKKKRGKKPWDSDSDSDSGSDSDDEEEEDEVEGEGERRRKKKKKGKGGFLKWFWRLVNRF